MRTRTLALVAAAASAFGCSTIWSRGLVETAHGDPVGGAEVRVLGAGDAPVAATRTDANGCFFLNVRAPESQRRFTLEVAAPGFKLARWPFEMETPVLLVSLAASSAPAASAIRPADDRERTDRWTPRCAPPMPPGSEQLSPH